MMVLVRFAILSLIKTLARIFYRFDVGYISTRPETAFADLRLVIFLNHTSLYEPLFLGPVPFSMLWKMSRVAVVPGADVTIERPIVGRFFKMMVPHMVSVTRRRDESWEDFMDFVDASALVMLAPEGRMKRPSGLDRDGKPMTVRGGVADILARMDTGRILIVYSGGLHHVQAPGQFIPHVFKDLKVNFQNIGVQEFKWFVAAQATKTNRTVKQETIAVLEEWRDLHNPCAASKPNPIESSASGNF